MLAQGSDMPKALEPDLLAKPPRNYVPGAVSRRSTWLAKVR